MPAAPTRVRIVGVSGSGKSRLAEQVSARTGWPRLELDAVFWDAEWTFRDLSEARELIREFVEQHPDGWVIDGIWTSRLGGLLDSDSPGGTNLTVWLDHPRSLVMRRVIARTLVRGVRREELWHGNREWPSSWLKWDPEENIMRWAWTQHGSVRERMIERLEAGEPILRLRDQGEVDAWLETLPTREE